VQSTQSIAGSEEDVTSGQQPNPLTPAQEQDVADWVGENTILYDKSLRDYKDTTKRDKLWADKAAELGVLRDELYAWYLSMRTRYGKLYEGGASGSAARDYTEREKWIREAFGYLGKHIVRNKPKSSGLKLKLQGADSGSSQPQSQPQSSGSSQMPDLDLDIHKPSEMIIDPVPTDEQATPQLPKRFKGSRMQEDVDALARLTQRAEESLAMQQRIDPCESDPNQTRLPCAQLDCR